MAISIFALSGVTAHCLYMAFTFTEIIVLKCLYIQTWARMAMLDDDFVSSILIGVNAMVASLIIMVRILLGEHNSNIYISYSIGNSSLTIAPFEKTVNF